MLVTTRVLYDNCKPLAVIGYEKSALTMEHFSYWFSSFADRILITPEEFFELDNKQQYQYNVAFNGDQLLRQQVINVIKNEELNCPTVISDQSIYWSDDYESYIGKGTLIGVFSELQRDSSVGDFCIIENYVMISHHTTLGENVHVHPGVIFGGKSTVGNNCIFNLRATVLNKVLICNDVEVGAISNITKDIMHSGKYVGTVAKRIGDKEDFLYEVS